MKYNLTHDILQLVEHEVDIKNKMMIYIQTNWDRRSILLTLII